jgi:GT2 family glycosyltransferase
MSTQRSRDCRPVLLRQVADGEDLTMSERTLSNDLGPRVAEPQIPDLSIVLVCWNNRSYLEACLDSLYRAKLRTSFDVVVVDNGSTDSSQEMLRRRFPQVRLIENSKNLGLSHATNQGIVATQGHFVLLLNNDTLVNGPSIDAMVEFMKAKDDAGAAGGKLLNSDGSFQSAYAEFSDLLQELVVALRVGDILRAGYPSHRDYQKVRSVDWLSSACLLVRRSAFAQVGYLDEEYFIYGDEVDFQFRLRRAGWKVYYLPHVHTIHYGGRSLDRWKRRKMVYRGKILFYRKNYGRAKELVLRVMFAVISVLKIVIWAPACLAPSWVRRAQRELRSNYEVLELCMKLQ